MVDEKKYTQNFNFELKDGWDGQGYLVLTQGLQFNSFQTNIFNQGLMLGGFAILFNKDFELDVDTIEIIKLLINKGKKNRKKLSRK